MINDLKKTPKMHDFGRCHTIDDLDLVMNKVKPGSFYRGSDDHAKNEQPRHRCYITNPYWLGMFPVTQSEFSEVMGKNPSNFKGFDYPVEKVSWSMANSFCEKLTERERLAERLPEGYVYRLPTEAEWEYACRGGSEEDFVESVEKMSWYYKNSNESSHSVGEKKSNEWGFFDMQGNVFEWCQDSCDFKDHSWYEKGNTSNPTYFDDVINPVCLNGSNRVAKGGCWLLAPDVCRPSARYINPPDSRYFILGFRLALGLPIN